MALRPKTKERLERIEAAIAAGASEADACKEEGITTSWLKQMRTVDAKPEGKQKSKALTVMHIDQPLPVGRLDTEEASTISLAVNGSPKQVAKFLRMLGSHP